MGRPHPRHATGTSTAWEDSHGRSFSVLPTFEAQESHLHRLRRPHTAAMDDDQIATMKKVFAMFDQGKTGFVECSKFVNILNTLGQTFDEDELKQRIIENDPEKEGKVDFEHFVAIITPFLEE